MGDVVATVSSSSFSEMNVLRILESPLPPPIALLAVVKLVEVLSPFGERPFALGTILSLVPFFWALAFEMAFDLQSLPEGGLF